MRQDQTRFWSLEKNAVMSQAQQKEPTVKFRVELVWKDNEKQAASIYLTSDGRVILQGRAVPAAERAALSLPGEGDMISVDRNLIQAIKDML